MWPKGGVWDYKKLDSKNFSTVMNYIFIHRSSEDDSTPAKPKAAMVNLETSNNNTSSGSADLLGLGLSGGNGNGGTEESPSVNGNGFSQEAPTNNLSK